MRTNDCEREEIRAYFEHQDFGAITHLEKVASERAGGVSHDIWDVHCGDARWWAVTNPLNAYSQEDFKSRDVVLTFHVGLMVRIAEQRRPPVNENAVGWLPGSWRRWQQAADALTTAQEAEDFQAVGVRLRECLVSLAAEVMIDDLVPESAPSPQGRGRRWLDQSACCRSPAWVGREAVALLHEEADAGDLGLRQLANPLKARVLRGRRVRYRQRPALPRLYHCNLPAPGNDESSAVHPMRLLRAEFWALPRMRMGRPRLQAAPLRASLGGGTQRAPGRALRPQFGYLNAHHHRRHLAR